MKSVIKCDKNYLPNSKLTVYIEITNLCSVVPAQCTPCEVRVTTKLYLKLDSKCDHEICHGFVKNYLLTIHIEIKCSAQLLLQTL